MCYYYDVKIANYTRGSWEGSSKMLNKQQNSLFSTILVFGTTNDLTWYQSNGLEFESWLHILFSYFN
jgi:hypothetical protein